MSTHNIDTSKVDRAAEAAAAFLAEHPGLHGWEAIRKGAGAAPRVLKPALEQLVTSGRAARSVDGSGAKQWTFVPDNEESGPSPESEPEPEAAPPASATAMPASGAPEAVVAASGDEATTGQDTGDTAAEDAAAPSEPKTETTVTADPPAQQGSGGTANGTGTSPAAQPSTGSASAAADPDTDDDEAEAVVPDPAVLLVARALAGIDGKADLAAITRAAYGANLNAHTEEATLRALCALGAGGVLTCTNPFAPDDRDEPGTVQWWPLTDDPETAAGPVRLTDTPLLRPCPTCADPASVRPRLEAGELRDMVATLITERPGGVFKPGDLVKALQNDGRYRHKISREPGGAVRVALRDLCLPKHGELIRPIKDVKPLTYERITAA